MNLWQTILAGVFGRYRPSPPTPPTPPYVFPPRPEAPGESQSEMFDLINEYRSQSPVRVQRLEPDAALAAWAGSWATHMAAVRATYHSQTIGASLTALGYDWYTWGENVAGPWSDGTPTTPSDAFKLWVESPPHRANVLSAVFTQVGIGYADGYWCATFGRKA